MMRAFLFLVEFGLCRCLQILQGLFRAAHSQTAAKRRCHIAPDPVVMFYDLLCIQVGPVAGGVGVGQCGDVEAA